MASIKVASLYLGSVSFSLLILGLYVVGTARYLTDVEENSCEMTYMFEYPQYVRVSLDEEIEERYPRFGLYAYGEGFVTERLRKMKFSGIPVLFVPGNGGSHEQVRSLASVSLRKSIKDRTSFHFDYFTVSLGKDYSALYGGVLEEETSYVSLCISRISSLYREKNHKIVLIGHSMGGIVAKGALLGGYSIDSDGRRLSNGSGLASILVTMASPHRPIFLPDRTIARYYEELETAAAATRRIGEMKTTVVSIGGGDRDLLVGSSQTIDSSADLNLLTSGMPDVWRSTDHLCILWCKQLILTIVRALFDCVDGDAHPPAITSDTGRKLRALSYHFTSRVTGKRLHPHQEKQEFERGAEWIEDVRRQYTWTSNSRDSDKTVFLMIRLDSPSYDSLTLESINLEARDWVFVCSAYAIEANSRVCKWGWNLTNRTSLSPDPLHRLRRKLHLGIEDLRNWNMSHLVVKLPAAELRGKKSPVTVHVDLYRSTDRTIRLEDAGGYFFLKFLRLSSILVPNPYGSVTSSRGDLAYRVLLNGVADTVSVDIEPIVNSGDGSTWRASGEEENPQAIIELLRRSSNDRFSSEQVRVITFKDGETGRKQRAVMNLAGKKGMSMTVSLGPEYSYRVTVRRGGTVERIACLVRDRWPTLYAIILALCLLGVATRVDDSTRRTSITCGVTLVLAIILDCLFETFVAIGLIHVFAVTTACLVVSFGSVAHSIAARFLARITALPNLWFDWLLGGLDRLPIFTSIILLSLISATCGALAILLSVALFFLKLTRMYDDYVEELLMASLRQFYPFAGSKRDRRSRKPDSPMDSVVEDTPQRRTGKTRRQSILDNLLLFVTWSFAALPAIPSALVWAKNFRYETRLTTEDPTMLFSWLVLTGWASLGLVDIPSTNQTESPSKSRTILCGTVLRFVAWILFCCSRLENSAHYQWIAPPLVALCVTCIALLSLFSANSPTAGLNAAPAAHGPMVNRVARVGVSKCNVS